MHWKMPHYDSAYGFAVKKSIMKWLSGFLWLFELYAFIEGFKIKRKCYDRKADKI